MSRTCLDNVLNHCSLELAVILKTTDLAAIAPHNYSIVYNTSHVNYHLPQPRSCQFLLLSTAQSKLLECVNIWICLRACFIYDPSQAVRDAYQDPAHNTNSKQCLYDPATYPA